MKGRATHLLLRQLLEFLHQSVRDRHAGELFATTVSSFERVTSQPRHEAKVEAKRARKPVDGVTTLSGEDLNEIVAGEVASRLLGVVEEGFRRVLDAELLLSLGTSAVDTTGRLSRVTTGEGVLGAEKASIASGKGREEGRKRERTFSRTRTLAPFS
jgi:hypothetical protein